MKGIVFLGERRCEVRDLPIPEPGAGEALIRIMASGICGSDLHVYRGTTPSVHIAGHEPSGVVEKLGPGITRLKVGDRVSVHHHQGCGICHNCAWGEVVACPNDQVYGYSRPGSFGEYMVAGERNCIPLPDSVSFIDGAFMACVGGTAYAALRRLQVTPNESLAVFGLGPVGLSCALMGRAMGMRVIGVDVLAERIAAAKGCGFEAAINGKEADAVEAVREFSKVPGVYWSEGVDTIIETSGNTAAREWIIPSLRRLGRAAIVGVGCDDKVINPSNIHGKAVTILGSVVLPLGWSWDLARFLAASAQGPLGRLTFEPAVTHRFKFEEGVEALRTADEGKCGKVIFEADAR